MAMTQSLAKGKSPMEVIPGHRCSENEVDEIESALLNVFEGAKPNGKTAMDLYCLLFNSGFCPNLADGIRNYCSIKELVENFLDGVVEKSMEKSGAKLLSFYNSEWQKFKKASTIVDWASVTSSFCHVPPSVRNEKVHWIYVQCLLSWRETVFYSLHERLTSTCVEMIEMNELKNDTLRTIVEDVAKSYIEMFVGAHSYDLNHTHPKSMTKTELWERYEEYKRMSSEDLMANDQLAAIKDYAEMAEKLLRRVLIFDDLDIVIRHVDYDLTEEEETMSEEPLESTFSRYLSYLF